MSNNDDLPPGAWKLVQLDAVLCAFDKEEIKHAKSLIYRHKRRVNGGREVQFFEWLYKLLGR